MTLPRKVHARLVSRLKLIASLDLAERRRPRADEGTIRRAARHGGMRSLRKDGIAKARQGITSLDEMLRTTPTDTMAEEEAAIRADTRRTSKPCPTSRRTSTWACPSARTWP